MEHGEMLNCFYNDELLICLIIKTKISLVKSTVQSDLDFLSRILEND